MILKLAASFLERPRSLGVSERCWVSVKQTTFNQKRRPISFSWTQTPVPKLNQKSVDIVNQGARLCVAGQDAKGKAEHVGRGFQIFLWASGRPGMLLGNAKGYFVTTDRGSVCVHLGGQQAGHCYILALLNTLFWLVTLNPINQTKNGTFPSVQARFRVSVHTFQTFLKAEKHKSHTDWLSYWSCIDWNHTLTSHSMQHANNVH